MVNKPAEIERDELVGHRHQLSPRKPTRSALTLASSLSTAARRPGDVQQRRHGGTVSGGRGHRHGDGNQPAAGSQEAVRHHKPRHCRGT